MKRKNYSWSVRGSLLFIALCATVLLKNNIQAAEESGVGGMSYSVKPIIPENQRGETQSYFDLLMEPGQEQELEVEILNNAEEDKTIDVNVATATTDDSGNGYYEDRGDTEPDETLLYQMKDLVSTEGRITIPAGETKIVKLKVLIPSTSFDGVLAGGINFQEVIPEGEEEITTDESGVTIKNEYAYVVALLLRVNEQEVNPEMQLNQVYAAQRNWRNVVNANLQNIEPAYIKELRLDAKIREKGSQDTLYELSQKGMEMVPNSNFNYQIPLNGEPFRAGTYVLTISAESAQGSWEFEKEFEITEDEARKFNESDVSIEKSKLWIYIAIGGGILVFIILIFVLVLSRKKAKKQKTRLSKIIEDIAVRIKGND